VPSNRNFVFSQVTTDEQREEFRRALLDMEDWLYMGAEADGADASVFTAKLEQLEKLGSPIKVRVYEMVRRGERVAGAIELAEIVAKATNSWPETKPWLNATQVEELRDEVGQFLCLARICTFAYIFHVQTWPLFVLHGKA
jgi:hypothetical protein